MDIEESDSAVFSTTTLTNGGDNAGPRRPGPVQAADGTTAGTLASNPTSSQAAILVAVRVRPFSGKELNMMPPSYRKRYAPVRAVGSQADADEDTALAQAGTAPQPKEFLRKVVHAIDDHVLVFDPPDEDDEDEARRAPAASNKRHKDVRFVFDKVFGPESQQQDVYEGTTRGLLDAVMNGFNATVFAYGATGCGKTFTISGTPSDPGIIPLTMQELFERVKEANDEKSTELSLSYLEVYNETIRDLLIPPGQEPRPLALREDNKKGVTVAGLSEHHPKTVDEVMELVMRGNECRTMSPTEANATSSRSHAVLQVHIRMKPRAGGLQSDVTTATLSLIDLAGSERGTVTKNRGERMREGANINRSLLALANCINALCDPKKNRHIPYRDSKLTRLLKFSLGGNCRTVMITCVSPASTYYEETYNTLKYANRAKNIKTTVAKNTVSTKVHLAQYQQKIQEQSNEIKRLQRELAELRRRGAAPAGPAGRGGGAPSALSAAEVRKRTQAIQVVQDIRNRLTQTFATIDGSRWEHASSYMVHKWFESHLSSLKGWREQFETISQEEMSRRAPASDGSPPGVGVAEVYRRQVDELLRELGRQCKTVERHAQHAKQTVARNRYAADRIAQVPPNAQLSSDQKYQVEQEYRVFDLSSERQSLRRSVELAEHVIEEQARINKRMLGLNAMCLAGLKSCLDRVQVLAVGEDAGATDPTTLAKHVSSYLNSLYMQSITSFTEVTGTVNGAVKRVQSMGGPSKLPVSGSNEETERIRAESVTDLGRAEHGPSRAVSLSATDAAGAGAGAGNGPYAVKAVNPAVQAAVAGTTRARRLSTMPPVGNAGTTSSAMGPKRIRTTPRRLAAVGILGRSTARFASPRKRLSMARGAAARPLAGGATARSATAAPPGRQPLPPQPRPPVFRASNLASSGTGVGSGAPSQPFTESSPASDSADGSPRTTRHVPSSTPWIVTNSPRAEPSRPAPSAASATAFPLPSVTFAADTRGGDLSEGDRSNFGSRRSENASSPASSVTSDRSVRNEPPPLTAKPRKGILKTSADPNATGTPMRGQQNGPGPVRAGSERRRSRHARFSLAPTSRPSVTISEDGGANPSRPKARVARPRLSFAGPGLEATSRPLDDSRANGGNIKGLAFKSLNMPVGKKSLH